jgi:large subunit ribosomal protein L27
MATKKGGGSTNNGRDSNPKYLGIKKFGNEFVEPGAIIVRQRGTKFYPGAGTGIGRDHTIYATMAGKVEFGITGKKQRKFVAVKSEN